MDGVTSRRCAGKKEAWNGVLDIWLVVPNAVKEKDDIMSQLFDESKYRHSWGYCNFLVSSFSNYLSVSDGED